MKEVWGVGFSSPAKLLLTLTNWRECFIHWLIRYCISWLVIWILDFVVCFQIPLWTFYFDWCFWGCFWWGLLKIVIFLLDYASKIPQIWLILKSSWTLVMKLNYTVFIVRVFQALTHTLYNVYIYIYRYEVSSL